MTKIIFNPKPTQNISELPSYFKESTNSSNLTSNSLESICVAKKNKKSTGAKNKRNRKTYDQMVVLLRHFKHDPNWTRATVQKVKKELGMKTSQIYKWGYDQKLKLKLEEEETQNLLSKNQFSVSSKTDIFMTDGAINDYNHAVVKICNSIASNSSNEGMARKNSRLSSVLDQKKIK
jgi:hypothetical protein